MKENYAFEIDEMKHPELKAATFILQDYPYWKCYTPVQMIVYLHNHGNHHGHHGIIFGGEESGKCLIC